MNIFKRLLAEWRLIGLNLRHPAKALNSILSILSYKLKLIRPLGKPIAVDIEPTNFCNLRCAHCQVTHWHKPKDRLTTENFRNYMKNFSGASRIKLQGMGEPFLNKELPAIIEELAGHDVYIEIVSNGTIMTDRIREVLTQIPQLTISFSVDGPTKEIFEKIRIRSNFNKVIENIESVVKTRPLKSEIALSTVAFEEHKDQIKPTIALAKKLGIDNFFLQLLVINYGQDKLNGETVEHRVSETKAFVRELESMARMNKINLKISNDLFDEKNQCPWPWIGSYIDTQGNVIPCCRVANADVCSFGNLNKEDFHTIWYSKGYQRLREQIRTNNIPEFCRSCYKADIANRISKH
jgi:radical SAM protein with 4Fe4S-binding SPASM domain